MNVIIDNNLWISFLLHGSVYQPMLRLLGRKDTLIILCQTSIDEFIAVAQRKKFANYISEKQITALVEFFLENARIYPLGEVPARCRDPKDDYLLQLAVVSDADYLVTGDADLLSMGQIGRCRIVPIKDL